MPARASKPVIIPDETDTDPSIGGRRVKLTNLKKVFWTESGITKRDLLQYCASVSPYLFPHHRDRAMVMKRYPNGATGKCFFMKRVPEPHPEWLETCRIDHKSGNVIDFPIVNDLASLLWVVNLGCIDLNQWYARCDDVIVRTTCISISIPCRVRVSGKCSTSARVDLLGQAEAIRACVDAAVVEGG